jgi:hypothetical protein
MLRAPEARVLDVAVWLQNAAALRGCSAGSAVSALRNIDARLCSKASGHTVTADRHPNSRYGNEKDEFLASGRQLGSNFAKLRRAGRSIDTISK